MHRLRGEADELLRPAEAIIAVDPQWMRALAWAAWSYMVFGKPELSVDIWERLLERPGTRSIARARCARALRAARARRRPRADPASSVEDGLEFVRRSPTTP